jgi:hypothetical protein
VADETDKAALEALPAGGAGLTVVEPPPSPLPDPE